jgi:hypothetical protein
MDARRHSGLWKNGIAPQAGELDEQEPSFDAPATTAKPGPYQYYQPPHRASDTIKRSFSQRAADADTAPFGAYDDAPGTDLIDQQNHLLSASQALNEKIAEPVRSTLTSDPATLSALLSQTQHVNSLASPTLQHQPPAPRIDPDYVPENLRARVWSPEPSVVQNGPKSPLVDSSTPAQHQTRQVSGASNASESIRRTSVSERSPLQHLESWTKQEKRARVVEAEQRAQQRNQRSPEDTAHAWQENPQKPSDRSISDGAPNRSSQRGKERRHARQASEGAANSARELERTQITSPQPSSPTMAKRTQPPSSDPRSTSRIPKSSNVAGADASRQQSKSYGNGTQDGTRNAVSAANVEAAERGKAAYERRKSQMAAEQLPPATGPISPVTPHGFSAAYGETRDDAGQSGHREAQETRDLGSTKHVLQNARVGGSKHADSEADGSVPERVLNPKKNGVKYAEPPQTVNAHKAKQQVGFGVDEHEGIDETKHKHHRLGDFFHHHGESRSYQESTKPLEDWRKAGTARLTVEDLYFEQTNAAAAAAASAAANREANDAAWWEKNQHSRASWASPVPDLEQYSGAYEEHALGFQPRLFLKCGPLLRYTGIRTEAAVPARHSRENTVPLKEVWRGSIMIVTHDERSDFSRTPVLRIFAQPADLLEPPSHRSGDEQAPAPSYEDPLAGQVKISRTGRVLYVRPVDDIEHGVDLSREESNHGLFAATRVPPRGSKQAAGANSKQLIPQNRVKARDGEKAKRHREVKACRLHVEQGHTFWRFNVEVELGSQQQRIAYRINKGPVMSFWVPARGETMNAMFHSCNGFSVSVNPDDFCGPDPLWRDVLNRHQSRPFHLMIGGGDQIYNDAAMRDTTLFRQWLHVKPNLDHKYTADFTEELQLELERFYLERYCMWFSQGLFGMANSQIPMVNIWDDHDIIDGFGSYPERFMSSKIFTGLGAVAFKYYMLFQHQSVVAETEKEEPSWLLGSQPGPFISQHSRSVFLKLGRKVAFLGLDCRTERRRDEILCQGTYDNVFNRCRTEIIKGETKHLIVLLGVPIAYPRLNFLENILTSRMMDPVKAMGRAGMLGGFINKFDGGVEILDDLDDHWTAKHHKAERNWFIQELQELAAEKSVRITILGGDVHLGAVGQFYTAKKLGIRKDKDHRYMPNVISSAIVNTPPPTMMADVLNKRNKIHHLDDNTDEDLIPMFDHDVDGSRRNNRTLLPRRNYCMIKEWIPGSTPPSSPPPERATPVRAATYDAPGLNEGDAAGRKYPPGSMKRTMSLSRAGNLVRRLSSSSKRRPHPPVSMRDPAGGNGQGPYPSLQRANSLGAQVSNHNATGASQDDFERPTFLRRPTNLSEKAIRKAMAKGGPEDSIDMHIDLRDGLDISLCMEIDQHDPAGATMPYRLLVPALTYGGVGDLNTARFSSHRKSLIDRLRGFRSREAPNNNRASQDAYDYEDSIQYSGSRTASITSDPANAAAVASPTAPAAALGLTNTGRGARNTNHIPMNDGYDDDSQASYSAHPDSHHHSYNQGLSLSPPPIGAAAAAAPTRQSSSRIKTTSTPRASATAAAKTAPRRATPYNPDDIATYSDGDEYNDDAATDATGTGTLLSSEQQHDDRNNHGNNPHYLPPPQAMSSGREVRHEEFAAAPASSAGPNGGGGFLRKFSLQQDRSSPQQDYYAANDLGRSGGSVRRKGWKIWKS